MGASQTREGWSMDGGEGIFRDNNVLLTWMPSQVGDGQMVQRLQGDSEGQEGNLCDK